MYNEIALNNQLMYKQMEDGKKMAFIRKVFEYYGNEIPYVEYDKDKIMEQFQELKNRQKLKISETKVIDIDYLKNYVLFCSLSDYYQNKHRVRCSVRKKVSPYEYYIQNYEIILNEYFLNQYEYYEDGLVIKECDYKKPENSVNPILLQNIMYSKISFCTVFKPYIFKYFIEKYRISNILDLSSGWGDRLIAACSVDDKIKKYVGIDPNKNLFEGYEKMIDDLAIEKDKYIMVNNGSQNINFFEYGFFEMIFWSPPFYDQEIYTKDKTQSIEIFKSYIDWEEYFLLDTINKSVNTLVRGGKLILYLGNIDFRSFNDKISKNKKITFKYNLQWIGGNNIKNYLIYEKITDKIKCNVIKTQNEDMVESIKTHLLDGNPEPLIIQTNINGKRIHVIQEGKLVAGTKQRAAVKTIELLINEYIDTIVYIGTYNGFGPVATSYAAKKLGLKAQLFISSVAMGSRTKSSYEDIKNSRQINTILMNGGEVFLFDSFSEAKMVAYDYVDVQDRKKKNYYLLPMGFNDSNKLFINILADQLKQKFNIENKRIWLVGGSGGILEAINKAFPNNEYFILLVGGPKYQDIMQKYIEKHKNVNIINSYDVEDVVIDETYYSTVQGYDSQIIKYVYKYGKDDDYVWNVASDDIIKNE